MAWPTAGSASGWAARNAPTFSMSGPPVVGSGTRARVNSRKASTVRTKNTDSVMATMSLDEPSGRWNFTAMPRPSCSASDAFGSPLPLEKRRVAGIAAP